MFVRIFAQEDMLHLKRYDKRLWDDVSELFLQYDLHQ